MIQKMVRRALVTAVAVTALAGAPVASLASVNVAVGISVGTPPPPLPVYTQPICPGAGYIWTPGYWAWGAEGYYWVPGVWVMAPARGMLWTPPYWGWEGGHYLFHAGYWGPHIGFYGGVHYGFGYTGYGYEGGYWRGNEFAYNRAVNNINVVNVTNVYNKTVVVNNTSRVSYNGGNGGLMARPTSAEEMAFHEHHFAPTVNQAAHEQAMRSDRNQWASVNGGRPQTAAMRTVNDRPAARPVSEVGQRQAYQQQRIANGVRSGEMTSHEAAHVERQEGQINRQVHEERQANGGHLTQQEHQQVNHEQNHVSREIHNDNHNQHEQHYH